MYALAIFCALLLDARPPVARIVVTKPGNSAVIEITGIGNEHTLADVREAKLTAAELAQVCTVKVAGGSMEELAQRLAVAGTWSVTEKAIRFEPQFPLSPGLDYRVECDLMKLPRVKPKPDSFSLSLSIPRPPPGPTTTIAAVFPSANRLPENALRFYLHFSGQMTRGDIYRHLKLIRDDGKEVIRPFLELDEELWSTDGRRVTVLLHPGRVKRGLVPREEEGPILEEGHRYTLVISKQWTDAEGRPFAGDFKKSFRVGPPDEEPIDIDAWTLIAPRAGSDSPLIIRLAKPLDRALLGTTIAIVDAAGKPIDGQTTVGGGERIVAFAPAKPLPRGAYKLIVDKRLEDVCGNRVGESFEVDLDAKAAAKPIHYERLFLVR
jgi:hypothetical protein